MQVPVLPQGPTLHLTSLAERYADLCIQYINARELCLALDLSTDLWHDLGETMERDFIPLLVTKLNNCSGWFLDSLAHDGILVPVTVIVLPGRVWQFDDGHHRLAWAAYYDLDVPVIFDDTGAGIESVMRSLVQRDGEMLFHSTTQDEIASFAIPTPRTNEAEKVESW